MGARSRLTLSIGIAAGLLAASPALGDDLKASEARQDARLEKRVTLSEPRVWLGDLLEKLTAQTGVSLSAGDSGDGAGDPEVTVFVTGTRLKDLMSALWSLVSYRGAEWHWHCSRTSNSRSMPGSATNSCVALRRWLR